MKKTLKSAILVMLSLLMCLASIPVCAAESENQIMPRLSHMDGASFSFDATKYIGYIDATYTGYDASFVSAKLTVKVIPLSRRSHAESTILTEWSLSPTTPMADPRQPFSGVRITEEKNGSHKRKYYSLQNAPSNRMVFAYFSG